MLNTRDSSLSGLISYSLCTYFVLVFLISKSNQFFSVDTYIIHQGVECFLKNTIHRIRSEVEGCKQWCSDNYQCGGFTVYKSDCYFKNIDCKNNLVTFNHRTTYIKQKQGKILFVAISTTNLTESYNILNKRSCVFRVRITIRNKRIAIDNDLSVGVQALRVPIVP